jgi:hypothetical protein
MGIAHFAFLWLPRNIGKSRWFTEKEATTSTIRYENGLQERNTSVGLKESSTLY